MPATAVLTSEEIKALLEQHQTERLRQRFAETDPADVADLMEELESDEIEQIFGILDNETASEVMAEMDVGEIDEVVDNLPAERVAELIREMAPDDAADILNELDERDQEEILNRLSRREQSELRQLSGYEEDSGGGIMTPEYCAVPVDDTVEQAIHSMAQREFSDPVNMVFAVTPDRRLAGSIHISQLIAKKGNTPLREIIDDQPVFAYVDDDQESIALNFRKYDLLAMPVVDRDMRLVGRITFDDVMDVLDEEAAEDMAHMAGAPDIERHEESPFNVLRLRLPWLLITMMTGMLVSMIVQQIIGMRDAATMAAFVPVILAMGGNTGMQASAVTVRGIALGAIRFNRLLAIFARELAVGAMMGAVCGIITSGIVWLNLTLLNHGPLPHSIFKLCLIVAFSMVSAMSFAAFSGTLMPIILNHFKVDPAVASGPFVTTSNDLSASLIYLGMCFLMLRIL